jgi:RNA polymerase sigma factor (sigma-70 family)
VAPDFVERILLRLMLDQALDRLSPRHRYVIEQHDLGGESYEEIATALNCSVGAIRNLHCRAFRQLREELVNDSDETV